MLCPRILCVIYIYVYAFTMKPQSSKKVKPNESSPVPGLIRALNSSSSWPKQQTNIKVDVKDFLSLGVVNQ